MQAKPYKYQIEILVLIFILTIIGFYNSLAFIKAQEYVFYHYDQTTNILFSISFINALSFLFRPLGGIICSRIQHRIPNLLLPYLVIIYAFYNLLAVNFIPYFSINVAVILLIINCILLGVLLGGIYPQTLTVILNNKLPPAIKVFIGNCYFIAIYCGAAFSKITLADSSNIFYKSIIFLVPFIFCILAIYLYKNKYLYTANIKSIVNGIALPKACLKYNFWTIIRFTCFLTFVTSLNAFFLTIMPFYLVRYLNYAEKNVFTLQVVIFLCSIVGLVIGAMYHKILGRRLHLTLGILIKIILYFLFKAYVNNNFLQIVLFECLCMLFVGLMLSKIITILDSIFEPQYKLNSISIIYNYSFGFFSGLAIFLSTYLINKFGNLYMPSLIIIAFSYLSLISLWFTPNKDFFRYLEN